MSKSKGKRERAAGAVAKAADVQGSSPNLVEDEQVASQAAIDAADFAFEQETSVAQKDDVQGVELSNISAEGQREPTVDVLDSIEKADAAMEAALEFKSSDEAIEFTAAQIQAEEDLQEGLTAVESAIEPFDVEIADSTATAATSPIVASASPPVEAPIVANPLSDLQARIAKLQEQLTALSASPATPATQAVATAAKKSGPGSKPRPNVTYFLLKKPAAWASTPQRAQIEQILFSPEVQERFKKDDGQVTLTEPEFFEVIEAGAAAGMLRTTQPAVRVAMYYYNDLLNAGCIRRQ